MSKRKPIGKKLRFEVFKRDSFTCQYCGKKAPDTILHVDHIDPVSLGGENDILNLITSCRDCNLGKGARTLSDNTEIAKQREQLEELNERREQLESMLRWRDELRGFDEAVLDAVFDAWDQAVYPYFANETGRDGLKKLVKKFGYDVVIKAIDKSAARYIVMGGDGPTKESVDNAFNKLGGICYFTANPDKDTDDRDIFYVRGIIRNRLEYLNERICVKILREAKSRDVDMESVKNLAKQVTSWTQFKDAIQTYNDSWDEEHADV